MNRREYQQMFQVEDFHWWYVALHELIISVIRNEAASAGSLSILDAGCGTGRLCQLMQKFGEVTGFDFAEEALDCCRTRGLTGICRADLNVVHLPAKQYDVITSIDTLYHLAIKDESAILSKFYMALKPGGVLILNLVAHEFLRSDHDVAVHTKRRYTRKEVVVMLERAGFKVEKVTYRIGFLFLPIAVYRLLKKSMASERIPDDVASDVTAPLPLLNWIFLGISRVENLLLRFCNMPIGTSVFAVARKS
jgi:2-polyprenyl-3-methyl-5-hydroxy-6-metoxy-1,4-benzoquinol methylase